MKGFRKLNIKNGIFEGGVWLVVSEDYQKVLNFVRTRHKDPGLGYEFKKFDGCVFKSDKFQPILWIPKKPTTPREYSVLGHEFLHCVFSTLDYYHVSLCEDSEEVFAHLHSYYMRQALEFLNKKS